MADGQGSGPSGSGRWFAFAACVALVAAAMPQGAAGAGDQVANGGFRSDTSSWTFTAVAGKPAGAWLSAGYQDGGAARIASETGSLKSGTGLWEQPLAGSIGAGAHVTLSYAWKKAYAAKTPQKQDLAVRLVKPSGATSDLDAQNGAPQAYDAWSTVADKDVSSAFNESGAYKLQLRFAYKTGKSGGANATAAFDEVRLIVADTSGVRWVERAASPDDGAFGEAVAGTGQYLYVLRDTSANATPQLWRYDAAADAWGSLGVAGLPNGAFRNGAALVWDGDQHLYALGGGRYSDPDRRTFWRYDLAADNWTALADSPHAQGAGDALARDGSSGRFYAFLGSNQHGTAFASYDAAADAWTTLAAPPNGTDDGASLAWTGGDALYGLRGEFFESSPPVQEFWRYDVPTDAWSRRADIPDTLGVGDGGSLAWLGAFEGNQTGWVYALGGGDPSETPGNTTWRYATGTDAWERLPDLPYPVGNYNGNRLGYVGGFLHVWQGGLPSYPGNGTRLVRLEGV